MYLYYTLLLHHRTTVSCSYYKNSQTRASHQDSRDQSALRYAWHFDYVTIYTLCMVSPPPFDSRVRPNIRTYTCAYALLPPTVYAARVRRYEGFCCVVYCTKQGLKIIEEEAFALGRGADGFVLASRFVTACL